MLISFREISNYRLIILTICFLLTGLVANGIKPERKTLYKNQKLKKALAKIPGWTIVSFDPLDKRIIKSLKLDDYINVTYTDGKDNVSLYIGYYFSNKKIGAAHDPMVCFPGQGWTVLGNRKGKIEVGSQSSSAVKYSSMIVGKGGRRELVIYWFQSYDSSSSDTFSQKVHAFLNNFSRHAHGNAFVRVTVSLKNTSLDQAQKISEKFIKAFYPVFLTYIYRS